MNVDLLVYKDGQPLKTVSVTLPAIIGRGKDVTFTIKHPLLSRKHCEVFEESGSVQVRDLASLNGTFVNGSRVDSTLAVDSGSQLKLGAVIMEVQYNGTPSEDTIAADQATAGEAFDLDAVVTADTEVMAGSPAAEEATPAAEEATPAAEEATPDIPAPSGDAGNMVDLGDFEVLADAADSSEPDEALDLTDFEVSSPDAPPSEEMLDLGDFEISAPSVEEGPAAQDLPSLTDLAGAAPEEPADTAANIQVPDPKPAAADDPWAAPSDKPTVAVDDDDDLDAFLKDLG